ncbi:hypothetical protein HD806DRAFT_236602 [Xylariaceae sp. AK1471]|nr:hypothetical protein HD806DRAFT_236602 [Xylariaceae sp. AK1471]
MQPGFPFSNQPQSQPTLPSQKSPYFYDAAVGIPASQHRGRLLPSRPLISLSRSPVLNAPSRGTSTLQPLHTSGSPYQYQHQPPPYFTQGPAAKGYIPQQVPRYEEPIVPLRQAFSTVGHVHHHDKSQALGHLGPTRPHSVPSRHIQSPETISEPHARQILRPISAISRSTQRLLTPYPLNVHPPSKTDGEQWSLSPEIRGISSVPGLVDDVIPPKRVLPFPTSRQAKPQTGNVEKQSKTKNKDSSLQNAVERKKASASQSEHPNKLAKSKTKKAPKRSKDASADTFEPSKRGTKIRLIGPYARHNSISAPASTSGTDAKISHARECSPPYSIEVNRGSEPGDAFAVPNSVPHYPHSTFVDLAPSGQHKRRFDLELSQQPLTRTASMRGRKLGELSSVATQVVAKRSTSQASTVSSKTSYSTPVNDVSETKDPLNPTLMIDETMARERDISDIVETRLQQREVHIIETMNAEILVSKAAKDDKLFEVMERFLK